MLNWCLEHWLATFLIVWMLFAIVMDTVNTIRQRRYWRKQGAK